MWRRLRILWLLWCLSRKYKTQRFGQIIFNYVLDHRDPTWLFFIPDRFVSDDLRRKVLR